MAFDIKRLDIYRKIPKDLTQPTTTGAVVSGQFLPRKIISIKLLHGIFFSIEVLTYIYSFIKLLYEIIHLAKKPLINFNANANLLFKLKGTQKSILLDL